MVDSFARYFETDSLSDQTLYNYLKRVFLKFDPLDSLKVNFDFNSLCEEFSACIAEDIIFERYERLHGFMRNHFYFSEDRMKAISNEIKQTLPNRLDKFVFEGRLKISETLACAAVPVNYSAIKGPWYSLEDRI